MLKCIEIIRKRSNSGLNYYSKLLLMLYWVVLSSIIILTSRNIEHHLQNMQNYHIFQYYPVGHPLQGFPCHSDPLIMVANHQLFYLPSTSPRNHFFFHYDTPQVQSFTQFQQFKVGNKIQDDKKAETYSRLQEKSPERKKSEQMFQQTQCIRVANRNILPNTINLLLSYIRRINRSGKNVHKIISNLTQNPNFSTKKFYAYQAYIKEKIPFHKTKQTLSQIAEYRDSNYAVFTLQQQQFYNKVCRILISLFLKEEYLCTMLSSNKIYRTNKNDHLKIRRYLQLKLRKVARNCWKSIE